MRGGARRRRRQPCWRGGGVQLGRGHAARPRRRARVRVGRRARRAGARRGAGARARARGSGSPRAAPPRRARRPRLRARAPGGSRRTHQSAQVYPDGSYCRVPRDLASLAAGGAREATFEAGLALVGGGLARWLLTYDLQARGGAARGGVGVGGGEGGASWRRGHGRGLRVGPTPGALRRGRRRAAPLPPAGRAPGEARGVRALPAAARRRRAALTARTRACEFPAMYNTTTHKGRRAPRNRYDTRAPRSAPQTVEKARPASAGGRAARAPCAAALVMLEGWSARCAHGRRACPARPPPPPWQACRELKLPSVSAVPSRGDVWERRPRGRRFRCTWACGGCGQDGLLPCAAPCATSNRAEVGASSRAVPPS